MNKLRTEVEEGLSATNQRQQPGPGSTQKVISHTKEEIDLLHLFGKTELFEGVGLALREIVEGLVAAHQLLGLSRFDVWAKQCQAFAKRVKQLEDEGCTRLGLPSTEASDHRAGDLLSNLRDSTLDPEALLRAKSMLGICIVRHLSNTTTLPNNVVSAYVSLLSCRGVRSRQHADWRRLSECQSLDIETLKLLTTEVSNKTVKEFLDELLVGLSSAIKAPTTNSQLARVESRTLSTPEDFDEDDDDQNGDFEQSLDSSGDCLAHGDRHATKDLQWSSIKVEDDQDAQNYSLIGWRIVDGMRAPFTRRLGITESWSVLPMEDLQTVCRRLKHAFEAGDLKTRNFVFLAYQSQQWSLPPHLALTVPLDKSSPVHYDVTSGHRSWAYAEIIGKDTAAEPESRADRLPCTLVQLAIDPDLAEHARQQLSVNPSANTIAGLIQAGTSSTEVKAFLREYRTFLRSMGDTVHPAYAGRFARSFGPTVKRITGSDILSVFTACDSSMSAGGMLHYVTLTKSLLRTWNKKIHSQLGWREPSEPIESPDEGVGAGIALQPELYAQGWHSLQRDAAVALEKISSASSVSEIAIAWTDLSRARLLSMGCLTGHRLTRIGRVTAEALFGCEDYICISDKVTSLYDSYRLMPVTDRMEELRECLFADLDQLRHAICRVNQDSLNLAVASAAPSKAVFFGLKIVCRSGAFRLKREALTLNGLNELSQKHFKSNSNIGRHTLVSMLAQAGMDPWLIRALTGHSAAQAEVFGDACSLPARELLGQLKNALDQCLEDDRFKPFCGNGNRPGFIRFTRKRALPKPECDPYVHPAISIDGHLLPPPADRYSTTSLSLIDQCRRKLLLISKEDGDLKPWVDWLLCSIVYDGLHSADLTEIFNELPASLARLGSSVIAKWSREGRSNLFALPLTPPSLAALSRCNMDSKPKWTNLVNEAGRWLQQTFPDLVWPASPSNAILTLVAMAGRWQRVHVSPAAHAASLHSVMSATFTAHSLLRLVQSKVRLQLPLPPPETRLIRAKASRSTTIKSRPAIKEIGTVLFRYQNKEKRLGENHARARKVLQDLEMHDSDGDLPAMAILAVVRKEMSLILEQHKDSREVSGLASYWTEVEMSLSLVSPFEDMQQWSADDFTAWIALAIAAIRADAHRKQKKGGAELHGLRRFLRTARLLGWDVPYGLVDGSDFYAQDGMRVSAASTLLLEDDFELVREIVSHKLHEFPFAQGRADILIDVLKSVPGRLSEICTLLARCVTPDSNRLCIQPAGHSILKNALATRLVEIPEHLCDRMLGLEGSEDEIDALGEFLFLDGNGNDWTMLSTILSAIHQAMSIVTMDINVRFHSTRGSAACRLAYPSWEGWAHSLLSGTTGADYGGRPLGISRDAVAQAIAALGHGRVKTFLGYYMPVWPWVKAHELRLTLHHLSVPPAFERALFGSTDARRAASSRARNRLLPFDVWDWIGQRLTDRLAVAPLQDDGLEAVTVRNEIEPVQNPTLVSLVRFGLLRLTEVSSSEAGHICGVGVTCTSVMDQTLARLAPSTEAVWQRRGQSRGDRGRETDKRLVRSSVGDAFVEHFAQLSIEQLNLLKVCLDVNRSALLLLSSSRQSNMQRIQELSKIMPLGVARLLVREAANSPLEPSPNVVESLEETVVFGDPERDVGKHPLYQVEPVEAQTPSQPSRTQHNRKRTGPFTGLARATCIAALAAHETLGGGR